jgi:hypothetical protein
MRELVGGSRVGVTFTINGAVVVARVATVWWDLVHVPVREQPDPEAAEGTQEAFRSWVKAT